MTPTLDKALHDVTAFLDELNTVEAQVVRDRLLEAYDLQKAEERAGWIAVSERTPEDDVSVLFVRRSSSGMLSVDYGPRRPQYINQYYWGFDYDWDDSEIVCWRPLPALPEVAR